MMAEASTVSFCPLEPDFTTEGCLDLCHLLCYPKSHCGLPLPYRVGCRRGHLCLWRIGLGCLSPLSQLKEQGSIANNFWTVCILNEAEDRI